MRWKAASALEHIGSERGIGPLLEALHDKDSTVRWCAANALGATRSENAVEGLIVALNDPDVDVQYHAASALGWIKSEKAVEPLIATLRGGRFKKPRIAAVYALSQITSKKALVPLIHCLSDDDEEIRAGAASALGAIPSEESVAALINCLSDKSLRVRRSAVWSLGGIGSVKAVSPLLNLLRQRPGYETEEAAIKALGAIGTEEAVEPLLKALFSVYSSFDAAQSLAQIDKTKLVIVLPNLLQSESPLVRRKAAQLVSYYCNSLELSQHLIKLAETDSDENVRTSVSASLASYQRKLQYFDILISTTTNDPSRLCPPQLLTAQERAELE